MNILRVPIKKQWFDLIASGEKKEEYREIKPHWLRRLCTTKSETEGGGAMTCDIKHFDAVKFTNGYGLSKPSILVECKGITIGKGKKEWGAPDEDVFIISLGEEIEEGSLPIK